MHSNHAPAPGLHGRVLGLAVSTCCALAAACAGEAAPKAAAGASIVHLEDELGRARVTSASVPEAARAELAWDFGEARPEWRLADASLRAGLARVEREQTEGGWRISLAVPERGVPGLLIGGVATDVPESTLGAWSGLRVRLRSSSRLAGIAAVHGLGAEDALPSGFAFFMNEEGTAPVFNDGSVQTYLLPLLGPPDETLRDVALVAAAPGPATFELLSIALVPRGAAYVEDVGVCSLTRGAFTRRTLYAHAPASIAWTLRVPEGGRCDLGLACSPGEAILYRAAVRAGSDERRALLEERVEDPDAWAQRSLDLSRWAGREVELVLEAESDAPGAVAFFGAPIVSGRAPSPRPNVVFYVIDGGGADFMSLYGYNRRTTPFLERLAEEGVVFERAHSNSTWTQPSTASFMTSLHHSVLGGLRRGVHSTPVPAAATTMAEHMHRGGYQTASFTTNPNAARVIGLERGVDLMRDVASGHHSISSAELHEHFFRFRADYPGTPYWVHFQTTDVHEPNEPVAPFSGLYVSSEQEEQLEEWEGRLFQSAGHLFGTTSIADFYDRAIEAAEVDRHAFYNGRRGLYDETMAFQDRELMRFVERLKATGEWENTIFVLGSDHGHPAGTFARWGRGLLEPRPDPWEGALFDAFNTRVPFLIVWPARIPGGRRVEQAVSMIDVLPTILDLAGLPQPDVKQGRSLAPLLLGGELEPRPVILDEFRVDEATGEMVGNIELIDGRWGASLQIGPGPRGAGDASGRYAIPSGGRWGAVHPYFAEVPRLLLYDLWRDPYAVEAVNDEHPALVERYRRELLSHWELHQALAGRFTDSGETSLTPEMLEQLQSLGYVR